MAHGDRGGGSKGSGKDDGGESGLSDNEKQEVEERKGSSSRVIHEVVREEGEDELARPSLSLMFSGLVAGFAITASLLGEVFLHAGLPDTPWRPLVESLGYTLGFIIVIMGRLQLFTESTVTAVLPLAAKPSVRKLVAMLRLWSIVFLSNMAGTLAVSLMLNSDLLLSPEHQAAMLALSQEVFAHDALHILMLGIPSGFLVGAIAWILPNSREDQIWVIFFLTYLIALGGFSHVVAGSGEAWYMWLSGHASLGRAVGGVILPSLAGNILGGSVLFAVMSHGQVRGELDNV